MKNFKGKRAGWAVLLTIASAAVAATVFVATGAAGKSSLTYVNVGAAAFVLEDSTCGTTILTASASLSPSPTTSAIRYLTLEARLFGATILRSQPAYARTVPKVVQCSRLGRHASLLHTPPGVKHQVRVSRDRHKHPTPAHRRGEAAMALQRVGTGTADTADTADSR